MDTTKIRIIAAGDARTPLRDELGRWEPGQYLGRDARGEPKAQEVEETEQVRRALGRGDLVRAPAPPQAVAPAPEPASPTATTPTATQES